MYNILLLSLYYRGEAFRIAFNLIPKEYTVMESKSRHKLHLLALTATATKRVERDVMVARLGFPRDGYNRYTACPVNEKVYLAVYKVGHFISQPHWFFLFGTLKFDFVHCSSLYSLCILSFMHCIFDFRFCVMKAILSIEPCISPYW